MYKRIHVEIESLKSFDIVIGAGMLSDLGELFDFEPYSVIILVSDTATDKLYGGKLVQMLKAAGKRVLAFTIPRGEKSKSLGEAERGYRFMMDNSVDRRALLCVLGGGVVGDFGGYIAATYLRGIDYIQLPTTLLAQVDSSIGGKVGVNFGGKKNIIGSFYQPRAIISDVTVLGSLPVEEMRNGIAEVIKYGVAMDKELFYKLGSRKGAGFNTSELIDIVERCALLKADVIRVDETERSGKRAILNFGHTVGHAIEASVGSWEQHHGRAVAVGMVAAARISERLGMLTGDDSRKACELIASFGLPVRCPGMEPDKLLGAMRFDKKAAHGQIRWVLLDEIGHGVVNCTVDDDIVKEVLGDMCQ